MDETMRELNTDDLEQILDESRADESENQLQELMPEKEALFRQQAEEEAARIQAEEPAPVTEAEVKPEETVQEESAPGEVPAEAELTEEERDAILSQDTIRLDDLQEVIAMTNTRDFVPLGDDDGVTDETIRLDDIAQAAILEELLAEHRAEQEAARQAERPTQPRETVSLEDEYDEDGFVTMPLIFLPKQRLRELKRKLVAGPEKRYYELAEQGVGKLQLAMLVCLLVIIASAASAVFYGLDMIPENRMKLMVFGQIFAMLLGALMGCQQMIEGVCELSGAGLP